MKRLKRKNHVMIGKAVAVRIGDFECVVVAPSSVGLMEVWARLCPNLFLELEKCKDVAIAEFKETP
jgi:hypothetical protein